MATHPQVAQFVTGGRDRLLQLWDSLSHSVVWSKDIGEPIHSVQIANGGDVIVAGGVGGRWSVFDIVTRELLATYTDGQEVIQCLQFSPDSNLLAVGSKDNCIYIYQCTKVAHRFSKIGKCSGHSSFISHLDWSKDSQVLRSNSGDYEILYWNPTLCRQITSQSTVKNLEWATQNCSVSFETIGIWPENFDGTDINSVCKDGEEQFLVCADDFGKIRLFSFPASQPKKLTNKNDGPAVSIPESVGQTMSDSLKKRFSRGVQYNMKVVIKGDRNVGKSCLLERLQGKAFIEQYTPTEQIQVASIQWSFKATDDVVKVEVWDVVDRGKSKQKSTNLKLTTAGPGAEPDIPVLDAEFLDVYKGTHCVVMVMDITKAWTFDYVCRELPKVPTDIPVLLLGNHCDMGHHRVITAEQVHGFVETASQERKAEIVYGDSSMRNGFGLRLLHKFFGIPFLYLQKSALEASLRKNAQDLDICRLEINEYQKSDDSDYGRFLDNLISKKKARESTTNPTNPSDPSVIRPTKSIILGGGHPIIVPDRNSHLAVASTTAVNTTKLNPQRQQEQPARSATMATLSSDMGFGKIDNVDEFCPDGGVLDKSFLEDTVDVGTGRQTSTFSPTAESDEDEDDRHNPLVSRFDDEDPGGDLATEPPDVTEKAPISVKSSVTNVSTLNPLRSVPELAASYNDGEIAEEDLQEEDDGERKLSLLSVELEVGRITPGVEKEKLNLNYEGWSMIDTKERRSPEGGEDVVSTSSVSRSKSSSEKKSKDKDKKHKKKKSSKDKDDGGGRNSSDGKHHRSSKRKSHVDEFLKEMQSNAATAYDEGGAVDDAYEAL
uniref:EML-like second beta-propeller domain-containing protein n=1 Tax=Anopheles culicifacies TaxID=139723 RepID=A0A182MKJ9_9DIPT